MQIVSYETKSNELKKNRLKKEKNTNTINLLF